ncbi:MAG TPA: penicillin-insensitive murein endopeptidase [Nannocystaceae bacterium]|nr:penicillin-insensitive murein endopeptidase [Nannocystaceae bacterium]
MAGTWLAAGLFVAMVAGGAAFVVAKVRGGDAATADVAEPVVEAAASASVPVADSPEPAPPQPRAAEPAAVAHERSLDEIAWTVATPSTLDELVHAWSLPRATLVALNPSLSATDRLAAGTEVVVHTGSIAVSESVGPPNDGRLIGGVPFPEGPTWRLAPDRSRAYGTGETIAAVLAALDAYAAKYPDAAPIQLGEISARKGGPIYGHQSHQAGRDIDIRLVADPAGDRFDGERNWSLIKTLIDGGEVVAIYLNRTQQVWLRAAAEADVGAEGADRYFAIIKHEAGHTIHFHVRFRCPDSDHRCVAYSLDETDAEVAKLLSKLPKSGGGGTLIRKKGKLPKLSPKTKPTRPPTGKLPGSKGR